MAWMMVINTHELHHNAKYTMSDCEGRVVGITPDTIYIITGIISITLQLQLCLYIFS